MKKLFTDVVHDAVGNDTVSDQFDISYPASFYASSQDAYITGTLLTQETNALTGKKYYAAGNRGRIFSKLYAGAQPALDSTFGSAEVAKNSSYAERLIPWSEKVGNSYRISQCFDENERIYDSCLPKITKCFAADGVDAWSTYDNSQFWLSPYGNMKNGGETGYMLFNAKPIATNALSNNTWTWSFPFEERYSPQDRVIKISNVFTDYTSDSATNWYPASFTNTKKLRQSRKISTIFPILPGSKQINVNDTSFRVDPSLPDNSAGSYRMLIPGDIDLSNKSTPNNEYLTGTMSENDMIKFLFGFGDLNNIVYTSFTLNEDENDEEQIISSSYFTGFELANWSGGINPSSGLPYLFNSSSFNGAPILATGSSYFNSQFDQSSGNVIVKWVAPAFLAGTTGYPLDVELYTSTGVLYSQATNTAGYNRYNEYPWMLLARENFTSASFLDDEDLKVYNYVSQSVNYSYADGNTSYARGSILTSSTGIYWASSSSPSRHWVLGSYLSASIITPSLNVGDVTLTNYVYRMPDPVRGGKTISSQRADITASLPWKLSYSRAISGHISDYFYSSFTGMPGFPASVGGIDLVIEKLQGVDVPFEGTNQIQVTPQVLTDFTSSLYPPGEYQIKFSYVKTGVSGSSNRIDRAFIDNINILTFDQNQLTATFDHNNRIGYSHYPQFRQIVRDTRTSPYFPGDGLKNLTSIYKDLNKVISALDFFNTSTQSQRNITVSPKLASALSNPNLSLLFNATQGPSTVPVSTKQSGQYNQININYTQGPQAITNQLNPYSSAKTGTAIFNIDSTRISTINRIANITEPTALARLSVLDEAAKYLKANSYGSYEIAISPVIRGWKYGIYNGFPSHAKMIFRRNRYGQFRDMLEQRIFTKFFNVTTTNMLNPVRGNMPTFMKQEIKSVAHNIGILTNTTPTAMTSESKIKSSLQDGPITVKFVKQSVVTDTNNFGRINTTVVSPLETTSQNISHEATSATPFTDGESKNRPDNGPGGTRPKFVVTTSNTTAAATSFQNMTITTSNVQSQSDTETRIN